MISLEDVRVLAERNGIVLREPKGIRKGYIRIRNSSVMLKMNYGIGIRECGKTQRITTITELEDYFNNREKCAQCKQVLFNGNYFVYDDKKFCCKNCYYIHSGKPIKLNPEEKIGLKIEV